MTREQWIAPWWVRVRRGLAVIGLGALAAGCTDEAAKTGTACASSDLIAQCPAGSNPVLDASAAQACSGQADGSYVTQSGSATGQCNGSGDCQVLCQFVVPCTCGVESVTKEKITCKPCDAYVCGNSLCEGPERATCAPGDAKCVPCLEDCGGATCGDGVCSGQENPTVCPQDCARKCTPGELLCVGNEVHKCSADGRELQGQVDCTASGQVCGAGKCQTPGVCGNTLCDGQETPATCPQDCATDCAPGKKYCVANTLFVCSASGKKEGSGVDCVAQGGLVCSEPMQNCVQPNKCGNGVCDGVETPGDCPQDCNAGKCGNGACDTGESPATCPQDCNSAVCGNQVCELGEQAKCPQDCPDLICIPNDRSCEGTVLKVCNAVGTALSATDCAAAGQLCGNGQCVAKDLCGNGVCESPESIDACPADCAGSCGNGSCDKPYEDADSCAKDCQSECGDGLCTGPELPSTCPGDCPANCGNGTCDAGETRKNCVKDCGFCGDKVCQPEETPAASVPPDSGKESCPQDCIVLTCTQDADCDDHLGCTTNTCSPGGLCVYTPDDGQCGSGSKCLGALAVDASGQGCCVDADGDGDPSDSCGGNDCLDSLDEPDAGKFPGVTPAQVNSKAIGEVCNGVDLNCSGSNKATVTATEATLPVTPDASADKTGLEVAMEPGPDGKARSYLMAWRAITEDGPVLQYAFATAAGALDGPVRTLTAEPAALAGVVYSPERKQYAVAWTTCVSQRDHGRMAWVIMGGEAKGDLTGEVDVGKLRRKCDSNGGPSPAHFARAQETGGQAMYTLFQPVVSPFAGGCAVDPEYAAPGESTGRTALIGEDGSVNFLNAGPDVGCNGGGNIVPRAFVNRRTRFSFFYLQRTTPFGQENHLPSVFSWKPTGSPVMGGTPDLGWIERAPAVGFDGTAFVGVVRDPVSGLRYQRLDPVSFGPADGPTGQTPAGQLISASMEPRVVLTDAKDSQVAIVGVNKATDASEVSVILRKQVDGSALTPQGTIAKGSDIQGVRALWDGTAFRVFYTSKIKGRHQVYTAPLSCQ